MIKFNILNIEEEFIFFFNDKFKKLTFIINNR